MAKNLNGEDDYFTAWLETLEGFLAEVDIAAPEAVEEMRSAWEQAYLSTEHGKPVMLDGTVNP